MRRTSCCTLFVIRRKFSCGRKFFFFTKKYFVFVDQTATQTQIPCTAYGKKFFWETWRTLFIHYSPYVVFFVISPLFRCCLRIVYSGLFVRPKNGFVSYSSWSRIVQWALKLKILCKFARETKRERIAGACKRFQGASTETCLVPFFHVGVPHSSSSSIQRMDVKHSELSYLPNVQTNL